MADMTYAPTALLAARAYLRQHTGLPDVSLGIVGGSGHHSGYHLGWDRIKINQGLADYSIRESSRDSTPTDGASALDIGNFARLRELSAWIVGRCDAGTADTRDIREVIWSPDGKVVRRWDRLGIRSSGDSSHLTHTHISYHRDSETRDKTGLFRAFFEPPPDKGDSMEPRDVWRGFTGLDYVNPKPSTKDNQVARTHQYAHETRKLARELIAGQAAILARLDGADDGATRQAIREELAAHRAELLAELGDGLPEQIAAELRDVPAGQVEAAVGRALGRLRLVAEPGGA